MNLVFAGTPDFAAVILGGLLGARHHVLAVYTQPDRPAGRGRRLTASPVKRLALHHGLELRQPNSLRDPNETRALAALAPEVMVVAAYGLILPHHILHVPTRGCINVHASLLPRWRGAAPIQRAILAGDRETGVCIMQMEEGLDTGPVLATRRCLIGPEHTAGSLHDTLAELGREALLETLDGLARGPMNAIPQDIRHATYAQRIDKTEAHLDWQQDAQNLERRVRAFNPAPMAWTSLPAGDGKAAAGLRLRVLRARAVERPTDALPGEVVRAAGDDLVIACSAGSLRLLEVQPAGRKAMSCTEFLNASPLSPGDRLA